jgi:sugar phosphate isomerase/epimerase
MKINRRDALTVTACACLSPLFAAKGSGTKKQKKRIPIGLQLYAVRGRFAEDIPGTLKAIAALGYQGVEFWGYGGGPAVFKGKTAAELRAILDRVGLKCCGMHLSLKALSPRNLEQTIAVNKTLGNPFMIVAAAKDQMGSPEAIKGFAETLNELAPRVKKQGMRVGYHCHGFDFKRFEGRTAWDHLFSQTVPEVVMQLDIGNCASGGGDPVAILKKFPGRATTVHIKQHAQAPLEKGSPVWKEIFNLCETSHGTKWYIVEEGERGGKSLEKPKRCIEVMRAMGM